MTQTSQRSTRGAIVARRDDSPSFLRRVGPWDLTALAAEGSLARIYRARPAESPSDRPAAYAVKMLRPEWETETEAIGLLVREALVGRSVSHAHLVPILQSSVTRPPRFLVMPWLEGTTLRDSGWSGPTVDVPQVLWIARQVAEALDALHTAGWRHGDVTPGNIFLSPQGHVTLLDLGFARREGETSSAVDRCIMGTCGYFAPETITSALRGDIRSDIYSLGVVLYEMFAGRLPYQGQSLAELAAAHTRSTPPPLKHLAPYLPVPVVDLVRKMLAKQPLRRPQTPRELIERLVELEIATFSERAAG